MPEKPLSEDKKQEIISCIRSGSKIEAIRIYREATGADLTDSKHVIDTLAARMSDNAPSFSETGMDDVKALITQGSKIAAIKRYREKTGAGLADAKRRVEELAESLGMATDPTSQKRSSGCGVSVVVSLILFAVVYTLF